MTEQDNSVSYTHDSNVLCQRGGGEGGNPPAKNVGGSNILDS